MASTQLLTLRVSPPAHPETYRQATRRDRGSVEARAVLLAVETFSRWSLGAILGLCWGPRGAIWGTLGALRFLPNSVC
eukprot:8327703-Pyramimonas_sp.AAC.1